MEVELIPVPYEGWFAVIKKDKAIAAFKNYADAVIFTNWKDLRPDEFTISTITKVKE